MNDGSSRISSIFPGYPTFHVEDIENNTWARGDLYKHFTPIQKKNRGNRRLTKTRYQHM
jgi:hypothetical protein